MKSLLTLLQHLGDSVAAMSRLRLALVLPVTTFVAGLIMPDPARAQDAGVAPCRLCTIDNSSQFNARPAAPLRLEVETRLDFDKVVFQGNGTASLRLSPDGAASLSGAVAGQGARAMPGSVIVRGEPGRAVRIDLPAQVTLFGAGSGAIRLDQLVTDLPNFPRLGDDGSLSFRFGGNLLLSGDSDGAYHGTIHIVVDYL